MPTISNGEYARLKAAEMQLQSKMVSDSLKPLGDKFGHNMAVVLAFTPYSKWNEFAKQAFAITAREFPALRQVYLDHLPKE